MNQADYIFPVIVTYQNSKAVLYHFTVPDFPNIKFSTPNIEEGMAHLEKRLKYDLYKRTCKKIKIPQSTPLASLNLNHTQTLTFIKLNYHELLQQLNDAKIKKTLTIPAWLNKEAINQNINLSEFLSAKLQVYFESY